jgi:hypothetical protein
MKNKSIVVLLLASLMLFYVCAAISFADDWRPEFDDICSKVAVADDLSSEELQDLVKRVDVLIPQVEASGDPKSKVFIFRLNKCRDLFSFILETRK